MRAAVFQAPRQVAVLDVAEPALAPDGVMVTVRASGICGSDLHLYASGTGISPGQVMGHEFAGEVSAVGPEVAGFAVGDRVAAMALVPCWQCPACERGEVQLCVRAFAPAIGFGVPGGFAERVQVPGAQLGQTLFKLPDDVSYDSGALLEPTAVATHAVRLSGVSPGATAIVLGLGPIGALIARVLLARGAARVVGVEQSAFRRRHAERLGIVTLPGGPDLRAAVRAAVGEKLAADVVFECTGEPALAEQASRLTRRGGTVMIVAVYGEPAPIDVSAFAVREVTIRGSSAYGIQDFAEALELIADHTVTAEHLVTDHRALEDLPAALGELHDGAESMKILIEP